MMFRKLLCSCAIAAAFCSFNSEVKAEYWTDSWAVDYAYDSFISHQNEGAVTTDLAWEVYYLTVVANWLDDREIWREAMEKAEALSYGDGWLYLGGQISNQSRLYSYYVSIYCRHSYQYFE